MLLSTLSSAKRRGLYAFALLILLAFVGIIARNPVLSASRQINAFQDGLSNGWVNWSNAQVDLHSTTQIMNGNSSLAATFSAANDFVLLHSTTPQSTNNSNILRFYVHGGDGGTQRFRVMLADESGAWQSGVNIDPTAGQWKKIDIPLSKLGNPRQVSGIVFQNSGPWQPPTFYLDSIQLLGWDDSSQEVSEQPATPQPQTQSPQNRTAQPAAAGTLSVNVNQVRHSISPHIYGVNFADENLLRQLNLPLNRWGGNATTRYNYQLNTSNRASDWFFENIPGDDPGTLPHGSDSDQFIDRNQRTGADTIMTMPLIGWTAKDRAFNCAFRVSKYGPQDWTDPYQPDCGNGWSGGQPVTGNDPRDTSRPITESFVQDWVRHLIGRYGTAQNNGVQFYSLDNEPFLWNHTHRDLRTDGVSYAEMRELTYRYASAIKAIDPTAQTLGPVSWGWTAFFYSGKDADSDNWDYPPDRLANGDVPFVPWYLSQMASYERTHGQRILDYLDLHFYPQNPGVALSDVGDRATQELRMRSTGLLWNRGYTDEYWIDEPTYLIPLMHEWVNSNYPGTQLALTEYNWGGLEHMNGAVAQADILGIFGREDLDLAALWAPGQPDQPWAYAFRMYRNYDGAYSTFGDQSILASSPRPSDLPIYGARRTSDGAVTLMVVNKTWDNQTYKLQLDGYGGSGSVQVYRYSSADLYNIQPLGNSQLSGNQLTYSFPGQSITLFVVQP